MRLLLLTLVLVAISGHSFGHFVVVPVVGNGQVLSPYHYVVHHPLAGAVPRGGGYPVDSAVSRETLEDQSAEGFLQNVPDIEDAQAHLDPDDSQIPEVQTPQRPQLPSLPPFSPNPRPLPRPGPQPGLHPSYQPGAQPPSGEAPNIIFNGPQPDGSYDFSYNLGDQRRSEKSDANGNVQGTYSYTGADGKEVSVTYTAGANKGYIPEGEGLLPPPPAGPQNEEDDGGYDGSDTPQVSQRPLVPALPPPRPLPQSGLRPGPQRPVAPPGGEAPNIIFNGPQPDGSYDFSYDLGDQSRSEKSDSSGNVEGKYSYTGTDGKDVKVTYTAGANKGFIPEGEGLLPPPPVHPQGGDDNEGNNGSDNSQRPQTPFIPPQQPAARSIPRPQPGQRPVAPPNSDAPNTIFNGPQPDGSYDFSYDLGDQSRSEKSDADGNVEGSYSYTGADGKKVQITYTAGANKGYIPEGEGLLPPPPAHPQDGQEEEGDGQPQLPQLPQLPDDSQQHIPAIVPSKRPAASTPNAGGSEDESGSHGGMPYSYNYDAGLSSKKETADDKGNVEGSYTYIDGAGISRTVSYTVKGDEGFIASGDIHPDPGSGSGVSNAGSPPRSDSGNGESPRGVKGGRNIPPLAGKGIKGGHDVPPPTIKGVKGGHGVKSVKGGASGWDKYPLGG